MGGTPDKDLDGRLDQGNEACGGDLGGPLICNVDGKPTLTGVVSWSCVILYNIYYI